MRQVAANVERLARWFRRCCFVGLLGLGPGLRLRGEGNDSITLRLGCVSGSASRYADFFAPRISARKKNVRMGARAVKAISSRCSRPPPRTLPARFRWRNRWLRAVELAITGQR